MRKKRIKPRYRSLRNVSILTLTFAIMVGCAEAKVINSETNAAVVKEQELKSVKVFKVIKQKIGNPLERAADIQSSAQFEVIAKTGGDIEQTLKKRGDVVQKGEVIVKLSSNELTFERNKAVMAVENFQNAMKKAKEKAIRDKENQKRELSNSIQKLELGLEDLNKNYNKLKNDYDTGLATKTQLIQMEALLRNSRMDLDQLKQRQTLVEPVDSGSEMENEMRNAQLTLQQIEQSISYLEVKAPVSGILTEMPLEVGMTLQLGTKIGRIQKLDPIRIKAQLTEAEAKYASGKIEMTYYLPGTTSKNKGPISYLSKVIEPEVNAYEINLEVPNPEMSLKPGMKLWMLLTDEQDQIVVTVPTYSLVKEGDNAFVFVLKEDTVEKRKVQLGRLNEPNQEVISGLQEGEQVVISNPNGLKDKEKVGVS